MFENRTKNEFLREWDNKKGCLYYRQPFFKHGQTLLADIIVGR